MPGRAPTADSSGHARRSLAVTAATFAFFMYVGVLVPILPTFIEDELGAASSASGWPSPSFAGAAISARPLIGRLIERYGRRTRDDRRGDCSPASPGCCAASSTRSRCCSCCVASPASVRRRCSSPRPRSSPTSPRRTAGPRRRATSPSPCSAASASVRSSARPCSSDTASSVAFLVAAGFAALAAAMSLSHRSGSPPPGRRRRRRSGAPLPTGGHRCHQRTVGRSCTPLALGPGLVLASGIAAFSVFSAFLPEYSRQLGFSGSGALFAAYSVVCLVLRLVGARLPERLGPRRRRARSRSCTLGTALAAARRRAAGVGAVGGGGPRRRRRWRSCTRR